MSLEDEIVAIANATDDPIRDHFAQRVEMDLGIVAIVDQVRDLEARHKRAISLLREIRGVLIVLDSWEERRDWCRYIGEFLSEGPR